MTKKKTHYVESVVMLYVAECGKHIFRYNKEGILIQTKKAIFVTNNPAKVDCKKCRKYMKKKGII